jgi:hypothetical protein
VRRSICKEHGEFETKTPRHFHEGHTYVNRGEKSYTRITHKTSMNSQKVREADMKTRRAMKGVSTKNCKVNMGNI